MTAEVFLICVALNVYFEARSEPDAGQIAVAEVVYRRAAQSGKPVCSEVFSDAQFSWTSRSDELKVVNQRAWASAIYAAKVAYYGNTNLSKGATHFHATYVHPRWAKRMCKVTQIGQHIFYKKCEETRVSSGP